MKLSIRSILTALVATFAFALPLSQAHANIIHKDNDNYGNVHKQKSVPIINKINKDGPVKKVIYNQIKKKDDLHKRIVRNELKKKDFKFDGRCENKGDCGDFKERYCYCDNGKCDDGNHNVPEPTPLALLGLGLGIIGLVRRFAPTRRS